MEVSVTICPRCGKAPKVKLINRTRFLQPPVFDAIVMCKPVIGRAHMKTQFTSDAKAEALDTAVKNWNKKAKAILKNNRLVKAAEIVY